MGKEGTMYVLQIGLKRKYEWNNEIKHSEVHIPKEACKRKSRKLFNQKAPEGMEAWLLLTEL